MNPIDLASGLEWICKAAERFEHCDKNWTYLQPHVPGSFEEAQRNAAEFRKAVNWCRREAESIKNEQLQTDCRGILHLVKTDCDESGIDVIPEYAGQADARTRAYGHLHWCLKKIHDRRTSTIESVASRLRFSSRSDGSKSNTGKAKPKDFGSMVWDYIHQNRKAYDEACELAALHRDDPKRNSAAAKGLFKMFTKLAIARELNIKPGVVQKSPAFSEITSKLKTARRQ